MTPEDASDEVRAGIAEVAAFAQRHAERQWNKQQAEAGVAALDWIGKNPEGSFLAMPADIRDWLAPDQWRGIETLAIEGYLKTDGDLFERLDRLLVYEPDSFAAVDLDRHRLSLDDADHARFATVQKAIAEGRIDPDLARYDRMRRGIDRAVKALGIDADGPAAVKVRADARDRLSGFEVIEGRPANGTDIAAIVEREAQRGAEGPSAERSDANDKAAELQLAGDNQRENKQARDIAVKLKLTPYQQDQLHREISGQSKNYQEVLQIAIDMFNK